MDDNSSDKSLEIAKKLKESKNNIELIELKNNQGKGNAIKEAINSINSTHTIVHG